MKVVIGYTVQTVYTGQVPGGWQDNCKVTVSVQYMCTRVEHSQEWSRNISITIGHMQGSIVEHHNILKGSIIS